MPPPPRPAPPGKGKAAPPPPEPTPKEKLTKMASSGYVDQNEAANYIKDLKDKKPDRVLLKELRDFLIKHQGSFDRGAFHKLKTFFETYRAENDV